MVTLAFNKPSPCIIIDFLCIQGFSIFLFSLDILAGFWNIHSFICRWGRYYLNWFISTITLSQPFNHSLSRSASCSRHRSSFTHIISFPGLIPLKLMKVIYTKGRHRCPARSYVEILTAPPLNNLLCLALTPNLVHYRILQNLPHP